MTIADELARLQELRDRGALTEPEFEEAKRKALAGDSQPPRDLFGSGVVPGQIHGVNEETWCTLMHLSQLLVVSGLGIIAPIVMWIISKDQSDLARRHGNRMMNWLLSSLIYLAIAGALCFVLIGFPLVLLMVVLDFVLPIIAAVKANQGILWSYPMAIRFFDED
ncbi:DUF4870 domain-containing protein [Stieleria sp. TO1_6]|uniref:DUF4870 domain-containing protein n=1 Tax=Stieleria tagensis TaxID=2956795 RepID=UPI00209ACE60|nr:DUF4870 domain-containing protein [Stieleria tagensis]MCO8121319.1 DUF4870 domain-containing protein [Stieleria tagensis]